MYWLTMACRWLAFMLEIRGVDPDLVRRLRELEVPIVDGMGARLLYRQAGVAKVTSEFHWVPEYLPNRIVGTPPMGAEVIVSIGFLSLKQEDRVEHIYRLISPATVKSEQPNTCP